MRLQKPRKMNYPLLRYLIAVIVPILHHTDRLGSKSKMEKYGLEEWYKLCTVEKVDLVIENLNLERLLFSLGNTY
jgi:hypothetical protein